MKKYLQHKLGNISKIQVDTFEWVKQFQWWKKDVQEYLNLIMFFFFLTFQMVKNSFNPFCWQIKFELFRLGRDFVWCKYIFWSKFHNVNLQICHSNIQAFIALFKIKIDLWIYDMINFMTNVFSLNFTKSYCWTLFPDKCITFFVSEKMFDS